MAEGINTLVTTQQILSAVRTRTGYELAKNEDPEAGFLKDSWLKLEMRNSMLELWNFLYGVYGEDFWHTVGTVTTVADEREAPLPADFWRLKRIAFRPSGSARDKPLRRMNISVASLRTDPVGWDLYTDIRYYLNSKPTGMANGYGIAGSTIGFDPIPSAAYALPINYIPTPSESVPDPANGHRFWNLFGCQEFVIQHMGIKVREMDEGDTATFERGLQRTKIAIQQDAPPTDAGQPDFIVDSYDMDGNAGHYSFLDR